MWLCNRYAIGDVIFYHNNLFFTWTTKPYGTLTRRRSSVLDTVDGLSLCKTTYTLKHTSGVENKLADVLNRRTYVLKQLNVEVVDFGRIKKEYVSCPNFGEIFGALK